MTALRVCAEPGCPELIEARRCPKHTKPKRRQPDRRRKPSSTARGYGYQHQQDRKAMLEAWVAEHGWLCPGYRREAHAVAPGKLTADHVTPLAHGGRGPLRPLCGSCNSARGARTRRG